MSGMFKYLKKETLLGGGGDVLSIKCFFSSGHKRTEDHFAHLPLREYILGHV